MHILQMLIKVAQMRRLKLFTPAWLVGLSLIWPAMLCADLELELQTPVGKNILSWSPEQQLQGYGSMASIFPTRPITASGIASSLPSVAPNRAFDEAGLSYSFVSNDGTAITITGVGNFMQRMNTAGLIVVKDGVVQVERYALGHHARRPWVSFSVTKSVVSMLVGAAIKDGFIRSVDDPVTDYLPRLKGGVYEGVNVGQLLQMSSGVGWNEDYTDPNADVAVAPLGGIALFSYMNQLPRVDTPGSVFNYSTGETNLVGAMLRSAIGNNLSTYLAAKIWQPFGMESNANWLLDQPHGAEVGGCCISATLRDYARIGLFALNHRVSQGGNKVLPDNWLQQSTTGSDSFAGYGYSWWLMQPEVFAAEGVFGQIIWIDRRHDLVIALHSAWPVAWGPDLEAELMAFIGAVTAKLAQE